MVIVSERRCSLIMKLLLGGFDWRREGKVGIRGRGSEAAEMGERGFAVAVAREAEKGGATVAEKREGTGEDDQQPCGTAHFFLQQRKRMWEVGDAKTLAGC